MQKYAIIIRPELLFDTVGTVKSESADEAVADFATTMDTDMNRYFKAVPIDELESERLSVTVALQKKFSTEFMKEELESGFGFKNGSVMNDIADDAYDAYCEGDGRTEYECLEDAVREWNKNTRDDIAFDLEKDYGLTDGETVRRITDDAINRHMDGEGYDEALKNAYHGNHKEG